MNDTQISIVIPVYNAENYLSEAIDSILAQTIHCWELILIDDGSIDQSREIAKAYTSDPRIRLILSEHNFINSLNKGIKAATGEYIARMDSDDIMMPNRLEKQLNFMESNPDIDICGTWAEVFGSDTGSMQTYPEHTQIISFMLLHCTMIHPSIMMRRSVLSLSPEGLLYKHEYPCAEDYKLWTDLSINNFRFANIPEPLLHYRKSDQQITTTRWREMLDSSLKIRLEYAEQVMEKMAEKDKRYTECLNSLIELSNQELLRGESLLHIVHKLYLDYLKNDD